MHTIEELTAETFEYRRDDRAVPRDEVMPPIDAADRLGVVMADPTDGLGAGAFVLSCVTAFYDRLREREGDFYEYPDYYTFQAAPELLDYLWFDIWPDHKHVAVSPDPEAVLRAVNDRAITVLMVPDTPRGDRDIEDVTRRSAERRIDACYCYAPDGDLDDADFAIRLPGDAAGEWYRKTLAETDRGVSASVRSWADGNRLEQSFREISLDDALRRLPSVSET